MTKNDFKNLSINELKDDLLKALWYDAHKKWENAHEVVQAYEGKSSYDRIHAYLHRKEGDKFNAGWWYRRIGMTYPQMSLDEEWEELLREFYL